MTNYAKLDHANKRIVMDRTFAKNSEIIGSAEYDLLQECRKAYPKYAVVRREIKKHEGKNNYDGLDYAAMKGYIRRHETKENVEFMLNKFDEVLADFMCVAKTHCYPKMKHWFLLNYPEAKKIGSFYEYRPYGEEKAAVSIDAAA